MGLTARNSGSDFVQAPAGTHVARCVSMVDLGTQHGEFQGKPTVRHQVLLGWELPTELIDTADGPKPAIVSRFYTLSMNEKSNLRPDLEAWRGRAFTDEEAKAFDITAVLGKPCMVSIVHVDDRAKVKSVMALPKGTTCPPQFNQSFLFSFESFDQQAFDSISDGIKKIIKQSDEYRNLESLPPSDDGTGLKDDIPF